MIMSPPVQILGGTCPPCPIGIDAPGRNGHNARTGGAASILALRSLRVLRWMETRLYRQGNDGDVVIGLCHSPLTNELV